MNYSLVRTVAPTVEPVTARELMDHLRMDSTNTEPTPDAPTVALASPATPGNVNAGAHRWRVTFVTADGETDGGTISAAVTVANPAVNGQVSITAVPLGGAAVTARKIYRTVAGGSTYLLLATINDNTTTTYTDNVADGSLGVGCPSSNTTQDPLLSRLIVSARETVENYTKRALITQTWQQRQTAFPWFRKPLYLWRPNLLAVSTIVYLDESGATQTLAADQYEVDPRSLPGAVWEAIGVDWPSTYAMAERPNTVMVEFTAGYGAARANIPDSIRHSILIHAADLYQHRESFVTGTIVADLTFSARNLLKPFLWREVP
jgi:uncharacterized phiE125 gp8 family phage protein